MWSEVPIFVGSIEDDGDDAESCHDPMLISRLSAQIDGDVHKEDGRQIPKWTIQRFGKRTLMLHQ